MKKFLFLIIFFSLFTPVVSLAAATDLAPAFNPLCWKKDDCNATRAQILQQEVKGAKADSAGWLQEDPCTGDWGKCLPSGITVTEIAFGGKKEFANLGDFLKTNFDLAIAVAGILAVIMIIIAGVQWVTSGGNSEMISSAKKRIGGALTGLLIAYLSYTILNTINPALVNLRLPQNFLIRPFKISPEFCRDIPADTKPLFAEAAKKDEKVDPKKMLDKNLKMVSTTPDQMGCGTKYFIEGGGGATCMGSFCGVNSGKSCLPFTTNGDQIANNIPNCEAAQLAVHFTIDPTVVVKEFFSFFKDVEGQEWMNTTYSNPFWSVCEAKDSKNQYIGNTGSIPFKAYEKWDYSEGRKTIEVSKSPYNEYYLLINNLNPYDQKPAYPESHWGCLGGDKVIGFVFKSEFYVNLNPLNANFYVSSKYVGPWDSISANGFVSVDQLKNGIFINAMINNSNIKSMTDSKGTEPEDLYIDGKFSNGHINPNVQKAKEAAQGAMFREPNKGN